MPRKLEFAREAHDAVGDRKFLTDEEVADRYRGLVSVGTLRNWRALQMGPPFLKIGKSVLYPVDELASWEDKNTVRPRRAPKGQSAKAQGD